MTKNNFQALRIVFMGTPEFAVASLSKLVNSGANIVGVVTAPDKPAGRGMQLQQSAVKEYALASGLNVLQPEKLKSPEFISELRSLNADLQIVVAFRMLPEMVWNMPSMGTINVHGSLLPDYRGAAPINWAVINGEKETGVTTFKLKHEIDTGNILMQAKMPIGDNEDAGSVHDRMMHLGAEVLLQTIEGLADGKLEEKPQQITEIQKHAPKIFTETCRINWNKSVDEVHNLVRGLSPHPGAFTQFEGKKLKIFSGIPDGRNTDTGDAVVEEKDHNGGGSTPGRWQSDGSTFLRFYASDGWYRVNNLQLEGKKRMDVKDFLRGYHFTCTQ